MTDEDSARTAQLMTPAKLAELRMKPRVAASPAAWLDQLAADAGAGHVRRLIDLRKQLETYALQRDYAAFAQALQTLAAALPTLDFGRLQSKGWIARATGKGREDAAGFVTQHDAIMQAIDEVNEEYQALTRKSQPITAAVDKLLAEFQVEVQAIERIMDQGSRWLQDMRGRLSARQAESHDAEEQRKIEEDTARCELLVTRLKQLRTASGAAAQAQDRIRSANEKRSSTLALLQQALDGDMKAWLVCMRPLAAAAAESGSASQGVDLARKTHAELQTCVQQAVKDCAHLKNNELVVVDELAALAEPLQAAA